MKDRQRWRSMETLLKFPRRASHKYAGEGPEVREKRCILHNREKFLITIGRIRIYSNTVDSLVIMILYNT